MTKNRRRQGDETYDRLQNWTKDQKSAERLAGQILKIEGFESIDPSHPLGGPDGIKDLICKREGKKYIVGVYFPRERQRFNEIKKKFQEDYKGVKKNNGDGFVFITNQKMTVSGKSTLKGSKKKIVDIYHLERLTGIINSPVSYGIRLEYLDIELTKEEQLSYFAVKDKEISRFNTILKEILDYFKNPDFKKSIPKKDLKDFKSLLDSVVGSNMASLYGVAPIDKLSVPIDKLKEYEEILTRIVGSLSPYSSIIFPSPIDKLSVPIDKLKEYEEILTRIVGSLSPYSSIIFPSPIDKLSVPIDELKEYEEILNRILNKWKQIEKIKSTLKSKIN